MFAWTYLQMGFKRGERRMIVEWLRPEGAATAARLFVTSAAAQSIYSTNALAEYL